MDYRTKSYGRQEQVKQLFRLFEAGRNVSMHGPRRLGKTFVLDRVVDDALANRWTAVKAEIAGCSDSKSVFRELCSRLGTARSGGAQAISWIFQRLIQFADPRTEAGGAWYQPFVTLDHEAYFERLVHAMHDDSKTRWVLLIDELPIFLKALHDKGPLGVANARDFMNMLARLQQQYPNVRWMITGSIGIEPLAQAGSYMGVLAKFESFELTQLTFDQSVDFVQDQASRGKILNRNEITNEEATLIVEAAGWRAAYYLDAIAQKLEGKPQLDSEGARNAVDSAVNKLVNFKEMKAFGVWEEHIRKHYNQADKEVAFLTLNFLSKNSQPKKFDEVVNEIENKNGNAQNLRGILLRLASEGFINFEGIDTDEPQMSFSNPLLRRWWSGVLPK